MLLVAAPMLAGCAGMGGDIATTDLFSKDANWFAKPGRTFIKNVSIETPPLTPDKPVGPQDLIGADGSCPGMPPAGANALADGAAAAPAVTGTVALGHTECDVARGIGAPDNVNISSNARGDRVAVLTYSRGQRAGIYTFTSGRLTNLEGTPVPDAPAKPVRAAKKKKHAAT